MDPVLKNIIRIGRVSSVNPGNATVRVVFDDQDDMVSYELPVIVRQTQQNKDYWLPDVGEQALCLFLPSGTAQGFCLGSFYSEADMPAVSSTNKWHTQFEDGTSIEYDRATHALNVAAVGAVNIVAADNVHVTGDVIADGISLKTHRHGGVQSGGSTTGQPV